MKIKREQEFDVTINPNELAEIVATEWADDDVIEFVNELGYYPNDLKDLLVATSDNLAYLNDKGKLAINIIKSFIK
jgi:hypothetical protein